jgi:hypothetical protein
MLVLGISEMVLYLSSEVLKGYPLFLVYKTIIFIKLLRQLMAIRYIIYYLADRRRGVLTHPRRRQATLCL